VPALASLAEAALPASAASVGPPHWQLPNWQRLPPNAIEGCALLPAHCLTLGPTPTRHPRRGWPLEDEAGSHPDLSPLLPLPERDLWALGLACSNLPEELPLLFTF
jgi:hypothetical protein